MIVPINNEYSVVFTPDYAFYKAKNVKVRTFSFQKSTNEQISSKKVIGSHWNDNFREGSSSVLMYIDIFVWTDYVTMLTEINLHSLSLSLSLSQM